MYCISYLITANLIPISCNLVAWIWVSDVSSSYQLSLQDPATTLPALILLSLASPSLSLLDSLAEISNPSLTFKILNHQLYWSYESLDSIFCSDINITLKYSSYMLTKDFLIEKTVLVFLEI
jgi:heme/copper-type cytochrome/quinol oxidase subunit 2